MTNSSGCNDNKRNIMDTTTIDGTPFSVLMSQAVKLKTAQDAQSRSTYDSYPTFFRNSIFPREEVILARNKAFKDRMDDAIQLKNDGNIAVEEKCYDEAITKYEIAASLFRYLKNCNPDWKAEGIRDEDIKKIEFESDDNDEMEQVRLFLISCYINIAVVSLKTKNYPLTIDACNEVLRLDCCHVKALFLRSKAYVSPKSAGATEDDLAIKDLKLALTFDSENRILQKQLKKISTRRKHQLQKDKATFSGLFSRGTIYEDDIEGRKQDLVKNCTSLETRNTQLQFLNFDNPSQKMVEEAAHHGIDLKNREVVQVLKKLQSDHPTPVQTESVSHIKQQMQGKAQRWRKQLVKVGPLWLLSFVITMLSYFTRTYINRNR